MKRFMQAALALGLLAAASVLIAGAASGGSDGVKIAREAALGKLKPAKLTETTSTGATVTKTMPFLSDATLAAAQDAYCSEAVVPNCDERAEAADGDSGGDIGLDAAGGGGQTATGGGPAHSLGCGGRTSNGNTRVNQDCTYRRQAEEEQVYSPADPNNIVSGQNDSRVGFNQCGFDFSTNNGKNFGDELPPFRQKVNFPATQEPIAGDPNRHTIEGGDGTFHTYDAGSDPALADRRLDGDRPRCDLVDDGRHQRHVGHALLLRGLLRPDAEPARVQLRPGLRPGRAAERRRRGDLQQRQHADGQCPATRRALPS